MNEACCASCTPSKTASAGDANPSQSATKRINAHLAVLSFVEQGLRSNVAPHARKIFELTLRVTRVADPLVVVLASRVLSTMFNSLTFCWILPTPRAEGVDVDGETQSMGVAGSLNNAVARWVPKSCEGCAKLQWHTPTEEQVDLALELMGECVEHGREALAAMKAAGTLADSKSSSRQELRRLQTLLSVVARLLDGSACTVATTNGAAAAAAEERFDICIPTPSPRIAACTLMNDVLELSLEIIAGTDAGNVQALSVAMVELEVLPTPHPTASPALCAHASCSILTQPGSYLLGQTACC